jgi:hypothetical protein
MTFEDTLTKALRSSDALNELRTVAQHLLGEGQSKQAVLDLFDRARQRLREQGRERDEDIVMEVMDFLTGWCSPHMSLDDSSEENGAGKKAPTLPVEGSAEAI